MNIPVKKTWVFIADGAEAKLFEYCGEKTGIEKRAAVEQDVPPSRELAANKRGRTFNRVGPGRSAMEETTDPHEHCKNEFRKEIAEYLNKHTDDFEKLVLVAAPKTLGEMRKTLNDNVQQKISDELDKNLTNIPEDELAEHLQDVLLIDPNPRTLPDNTRYAKP